jgi:hypothetical protein
MAHEEELYLIFSDELLRNTGVSPCVITTREDLVHGTAKDGAIQIVSSRGRVSMKIMKVTEAEDMYSVTPETLEDEVDEEWMNMKFATPFLDEEDLQQGEEPQF